ncbi:hypothetical protein GUJ93_ZPchr0006g42449 [Zizania palustris]|uniref:BED-type domain-containing protein n=1 Tax=Zizania palustris TaxID=103762 RepID=A0A8J5S788_ZIZPA|nr:hypothetical protein GUJ93_ZPchr0006g42449 [Zizania palustris]
MTSQTEATQSTSRKCQSLVGSSPAPNEEPQKAPTGTSGNEITGPITITDVENKSKNARDRDNETKDLPKGKKQKKSTSPAWMHYTKFDKWIEVNGQKVKEEWAKCNYCNYQARRNSRNGTTVFLNHTKTHNVNPGQQQLKLEKKDSGATSIEPYSTETNESNVIDDEDVDFRRYMYASRVSETMVANLTLEDLNEMV